MEFLSFILKATVLIFASNYLFNNSIPSKKYEDSILHKKKTKQKTKLLKFMYLPKASSHTVSLTLQIVLVYYLILNSL